MLTQILYYQNIMLTNPFVN